MENVRNRMKHRNNLSFIILAVMVAVFSFHLAFASAADLIYKIDGRVIQASDADRTLRVLFKHPATGEISEKFFHVSESAGLKHVKDLGKLEAGDLVSVDYLKEGKRLVAVYIEHIPLKGVAPATPGEVASALLRLSTNKSKS